MFNRIRKAFRGIVDAVFGAPEQPRKKEYQEPITEPIPRIPEEGRNFQFDNDRWNIYVYRTGDESETKAREFWDLFTDTAYPAGHTRQDTNDAFDVFVAGWALPYDDPKSLPRQTLFDDFGISSRDIDWEKWQEVSDTA